MTHSERSSFNRVLIRAGAFVILGPVVLSMAGCGGGGGGSSSSPTVTPTPAPPPPSPPPPPPPPPAPSYPSATSTEYLRNYALALINANYAYQQGGTGAGVTVAVVDAGVNHLETDLVGGVSSASVDIIAGRNAPDGEDNHGTLVAGVIAARFNGFGTVGVAYNSTILGVRADSVGSCATSTSTKNKCSFNDSDIANGIDYAVAHGAKVINLSLGSTTGINTLQFEAAMLRAVNAGVVFAISSGNESLTSPDYPAMYAVDSRFAGKVLAVGAVDQTKAMPSYSNKAGLAAAGYLVAPGDAIYTGCSTTSCYVASGTSFAAPHVSGALALLLQQFPNITGAQAVSILLKTADSLGDTATYGVGLINLQKAFSPIGALSVPTAYGAPVIVSTTPVTVSTAFGDAVSRSSQLTTLGLDSYKRRFKIDLASGYHTSSGGSSLAGTTVVAPTQSQTHINLTADADLHLTSGRNWANAPPSALAGSGFAALTQPSKDALAELNVGASHFAVWSGSGDIGAPGVVDAGRDAFALTTHANQAARAEFTAGALSVAAETGSGRPHERITFSQGALSRYSLIGVATNAGSARFQLSFGHVTEPDGVLGAPTPATGAYRLAGDTRFATARVAWRPLGTPLENWVFNAEFSRGESAANGGYLALAGGAVSTAWRLNASTTCWTDPCSGVSFDIRQPLRIEHGRFTALLADAPANYLDAITYSQRSIDAAPDGRQITAQLGLFKETRAFGRFELNGEVTREANNLAGAPLDLGVSGRWRSTF